MRKLLIVILILIDFNLFAHAKDNFEVHTGISIPSGSFADNNYNNSIFNGSGNAVTGVSAGVKYSFHLNSLKNLSVTLGIDIIQNGISQDFKDQFQQSIDNSIDNTVDNFVMKIKVKYCNYVNIPVLLGVRYKIPLNDKLSLYADAGMGVNFSSLTDMTMTPYYTGSFRPQYQPQPASISFSPTSKFATQLGGGVLINNISIGLHYNQLGVYEFKGLSTSSSGNTSVINPESGLNINFYTLIIGLHF